MVRWLAALIVACTVQPMFAQTEWTPRRDHHDGVHLRIFRAYDLAAGATTSEPIVVIGGDATIDGVAEGDLIVIGGTLRVGPTAVIRGDIVTVGGDAEIHPAAQIAGDIQETVVLWPRIDVGWGASSTAFWATIALAVLLLRLGVVLVALLMATWLVPAAIARIGAQFSRQPFSATVLGGVGQVLFIPALIVMIVLLAISVIGIPLIAAMPFVAAAALVAWAVGFAAVAARLGAKVRSSAADDPPSGSDVLIGYAMLTSVSLVGHVLALGPEWLLPVAIAVGGVGLFIEWLAWTSGLGAVLMTLLAGSRPDTPPALPVPPQAAPAPSTP